MWAWTSMWSWGAMWASHWSNRSLAPQTDTGSLLKPHKGKKSVSINVLFGFYPDFLLHQLPGVVNLLRGPADSEHLDVGIRVGWGIPLQLDPGSRLLADALDRLSP